MLMDLLWSDPTTNDGVQGVQPSPRGPGLVTFGPDRVKDFCKVGPRGFCVLYHVYGELVIVIAGGGRVKTRLTRARGRRPQCSLFGRRAAERGTGGDRGARRRRGVLCARMPRATFAGLQGRAGARTHTGAKPRRRPLPPPPRSATGCK